MTTVILSIGVADCKGKAKPERLAVVSLGKGRRNILLPVVFPKGKNLEAKRRESHLLIDKCIDAYRKLEGGK